MEIKDVISDSHEYEFHPPCRPARCRVLSEVASWLSAVPLAFRFRATHIYITSYEYGGFCKINIDGHVYRFYIQCMGYYVTALYSSRSLNSFESIHFERKFCWIPFSFVSLLILNCESFKFYTFKLYLFASSSDLLLMTVLTERHTNYVCTHSSAFYATAKSVRVSRSLYIRDLRHWIQSKHAIFKYEPISSKLSTLSVSTKRVSNTYQCQFNQTFPPIRQGSARPLNRRMLF